MSDNTERVEKIKQRLQALSPSELEVIDESHLHAGHAGARSGKGHFRVRIKADCLNGLSRIRQHQTLYEALGNMMQEDIHALAIEIKT
jgi:BolA protein